MQTKCCALDFNMLQGSVTLKVRKLIVRLRMWYARIRGHKEHRWDYEPSENYMGKKNKWPDLK